MSRFRRLTANIRFNLYGQVLQAALPFFVVPFMVRRLGEEGYGLYVLIWVISGQFNLLNFGVGSATVKYLAEFRAAHDEEKGKRFLGSSVLFHLSVGLLGAALITALAPALQGSFFNIPPALGQTARFLFRCAAAVFLLQFLTAPFAAVSQAEHRFDLSNGVECLTAVLLQIGVCALLALGHGLRAAVIWSGAVSALGLGLSFLLARRLLPGTPMAPAWDRGALSRLLGFGGPLFVGRIAWSVLNQLDKLVLGHYLPLKDLVYYIIPFSLAQKLVLIISPLMPTLIPLSSELSASGQMDTVRKVFATGTKLTLLLVWPATLLGCCFGPAFLELWLGGEYSLRGGWILRAFLFANFLYALQEVAKLIDSGLGKVAFPSFWYAASVAGAALSWPFLLPRFGIAGMAGAFTAAYAVYSGGLLWYTQRLLGLPAWDLIRSLAKPLLLSLPLVAAGLFLRNSLKTWTSLAGFSAAACALWAGICWKWALEPEERSRLQALAGGGAL